jgi:hypothetical protein
MDGYIDKDKQETIHDEIDSLQQDVPKKDIPKDIEQKL